MDQVDISPQQQESNLNENQLDYTLANFNPGTLVYQTVEETLKLKQESYNIIQIDILVKIKNIHGQIKSSEQEQTNFINILNQGQIDQQEIEIFFKKIQTISDNIQKIITEINEDMNQIKKYKVKADFIQIQLMKMNFTQQDKIDKLLNEYVDQDSFEKARLDVLKQLNLIYQEQKTHLEQQIAKTKNQLENIKQRKLEYEETLKKEKNDYKKIRNLNKKVKQQNLDCLTELNEEIKEDMKKLTNEISNLTQQKMNLKDQTYLLWINISQDPEREKLTNQIKAYQQQLNEQQKIFNNNLIEISQIENEIYQLSFSDSNIQQANFNNPFKGEEDYYQKQLDEFQLQLQNLMKNRQEQLKEHHKYENQENKDHKQKKLDELNQMIKRNEDIIKDYGVLNIDQEQVSLVSMDIQQFIKNLGYVDLRIYTFQIKLANYKQQLEQVKEIFDQDQTKPTQELLTKYWENYLQKDQKNKETEFNLKLQIQEYLKNICKQYQINDDLQELVLAYSDNLSDINKISKEFELTDENPFQFEIDITNKEIENLKIQITNEKDQKQKKKLLNDFKSQNLELRKIKNGFESFKQLIKGIQQQVYSGILELIQIRKSIYLKEQVENSRQMTRDLLENSAKPRLEQ